MVVFPNCKINLGLHVLQKRSDGFHDLETVFYPLPLQDILEIIPAYQTTGDDPVHFSLSGLRLEGDLKKNLCIKAYHLLKRKFPQMAPVQMHLHKIIPAGSGLGGGSADATFTLKLLDEIFDLKLSRHELIELSLELGSDCPFFVVNKPCFSKSRGEWLEEIKLELSAYNFLLVHPGIEISTKEAFKNIVPGLPEIPIREIILKPVEAWKDSLQNDFEKTIFSKYPALATLKEEMYRAGAIYASMSGSGSTVFGIFAKEKNPELSFPSHYFSKLLPG